QCLPVEKFHGDESLATLLADVVDGADVGMVKGGRGLCLSLESRKGLRVARHIGREKLQRYKATQAGILGLVNDPHAPAAEFLDDAVMGDGLANQRGWVRHLRPILEAGLTAVNPHSF